MNYRNIVSVLCIWVMLVGCKEPHPPTDLTKENLIPIPVSVQATGEVFELTKNTAIHVEGESSELIKVGEYLAAKLRPSTGFELKVSTVSGKDAGKNIYITTVATDETLGDEGYDLTVSESGITIAAAKPAGVFRGIQTLRQLLPSAIESDSVQKGPWEISTGTIRDYPQYKFRSSMLDVARHFFSVEDVKRYIDLIAGYKFNMLHLHLSDDQGWRIEIKSWPNLTAHGGSTQVGGGKGGFYTQEQYKDIVQYAAARYITIIPEVDFPGHTNAALASYPELNCNGKATELYTGTEVGFSTLCVDKEITYKFVDDVMRELAEMTPGPYIHLGGDESHATKKEDFIKFVNKCQEIVLAHNKKPIGWEEISQAKLLPNTVVQYWSNAKHAKVAVEQGAKIIVSPAKKAYMDMSYDSTSTLGLHWAAYIEVDSAYLWDPATIAPGITQDNILGIECPLWTETIVNMEDIEYMIFPRLLGYAEIGWSPSAARQWDEFKIRMGKHAPTMNAKNINFYKSKLVPWVE